ncbi:hypothetical protein MJO28_002254 [Puccinia striiformis f. sp. tritici]|uniref:Uncharacterized protein n=1 Tax=Puccinia striiformis f. sp. tritici TaxID=168172 RepID=A0ACC0EY04_9BASI|nr:hypothetical protein MJO28_002254 [Puccinia striiformis f. sp. tritici]
MMDYYRKSSLPDQQHDKEETWVVAANLLDSMRASRAKVKDNADGGALKASRLGELGTNPVTDHNKEYGVKLAKCFDWELSQFLFHVVSLAEARRRRAATTLREATG